VREGWEVKNLEDCIERVKYPNKIQRKSFLEEGPFPIISQEQEYINGYWSNPDDVFRVKKPTVIFSITSSVRFL
jgi:type I restriction enzyme S subunit